MSADPSQPKAAGQAARDQRRAAALRENLRRRKSQARARSVKAIGAAEGPETAEAATAETARTPAVAQAPRRETEP